MRALASSIVLFSASLALGQQPSEENAPQEVYYRDGSRTIKLTAATDLVLDQKNNRLIPVTSRSDAPQSRFKPQPSHDLKIPVFTTDSGERVAPVGGIILVLDESWTSLDVDVFLERHDLVDDATLLEWLPGGYSVRTEPGMPAIELANRLARHEGVVLSTPNFWREVSER